MLLTPLDELKRRVQSLQNKMQNNGFDGALLTENMDLYYFAGSMQQGFLFIPLEGDPLYMVRRNFHRAQEESAWEKIVPLNSLKQLPAYLQEYSRQGLKRVGLELDVLPVNNYKRLQKILPEVTFADISLAVREVRMIKSPFEIAIFRKAAEIVHSVFQKVPEILEIGKPEVVFAAELEALYRKAGHQGLGRMRAFNMEMFFGHVFSGENGALTSFLDSPTGGKGITLASPQGAGWKPILANEPVVVDYGGSYEGYTVDQTRVFSIGPLPPELEKAYLVAKNIQDAVIDAALPGASCLDLYNQSLELAAAEGLGDYFMGYKDDQVKYTGHGLGLNYDEFPLISLGSKHILQPGMVFALEPKFLFPGQGMVGLENTYLVTESGTEKISLTDDELLILPEQSM